MSRKWLILATVSVLLFAAILLGVSRVQLAKAASNVPLQLQQIRVVGSDYNSHASYRGGDQIDLQAYFYDVTGQAIVYTAHPAVYQGRYRLLNVAVLYTSFAYVGVQEPQHWVTIPKNAPLGTYKYWFTLIVPGYPNQTLVTSFNVVK